MKCYSEENLEWIFSNLKRQGKLSITGIPGVREILAGKNRIRKEKQIRLKRAKGLKRIVEALPSDAPRRELCEVLIDSNNEIISKLCEDEKLRDKELVEFIRGYCRETLDKILRFKLDYQLKVTEVEETKFIVSSEDIQTALLCQLIKEDIKRKYQLVPADRNEIIPQMKGLLDNGVPKIMIRADICRFFESVSYEKVLDKLATDAYIDRVSLRHLKKLYEEMQGKQEALKGIPRGMAYSSYLAEIFMQSVDKSIEAIDGVCYYRRYVDDIIIVASTEQTGEWYWSKLAECMEKTGLKLHTAGEKKSVLVIDGSQDYKFDYLGYKFNINGQKLALTLSTKRKERYRDLLKKIFKEFEVDCKPYGIKRMLDHLACMTGNGHLMGDKGHVSVGMFFSNKHLTDLSDLRELDSLKDELVENFNPDSKHFNFIKGHTRQWHLDNVKKIMGKWRFEAGFTDRRFCTNPKFTRSLGNLKFLAERDLKAATRIES